MKTTGYHSVHLPEEPSIELARWDRAGSSAFVWDATCGSLPEEYATCDLLYAELPWRSGYERYQARADTASSTWHDFMAGVRQILAGWRKPAVIVAGVHARSRMPAPTQVLPVTLLVAGRQAAGAHVYNAGLTRDWTDTEDLVSYLAARFGRVGDFCAGYGRTARAFTRAGGTFVASDINPRCVGYIAEHHPEWAAARP